jgi:hypothetical protein
MNSADLGNNIGWNFSSAVPRNLYWVGGGGNWGDTNHWSFSSGGIPAGCIPSPFDNVFFDQNSGFTNGSNVVNLNTAYALCKDMNWTGVVNNPVLRSEWNKTLYVFGSMILSPNMNLEVFGRVWFMSTNTGNIINAFNKRFNYDVLFTGKNGGWTLLGDFSSYSFIHQNGTLHTNGQTVTTDYFYVHGPLGSIVRLGNSTINVRIVFEVYPHSIIDAGTSTIRMTVNSDNDYFNFIGHGKTYHNLEAISNLRITGNNRFNQVVFHRSATFVDGNTFESITFSPGRTYLLGVGKTQLITALGDFIAEGDGAFPIEMRSTVLGQQAFLYKDGDPICLDYLYLTDINASGTAFRYAGANSDDVANNAGLIFEGCPDCFTAQATAAPAINLSASVTTIYPGTQATLVVEEIPAGFQLIWLNEGKTQELYSGSNLTFQPVVPSTTTFYAAFRDLSTGCVSNAVAITVYACPSPTLISGTYSNSSTAVLSWRSNERVDNNCWVLSLGNNMMSTCSDANNAYFETTICYQNGTPVFSYPVSSVVIDGNIITAEVVDLVEGAVLNWFVSEKCDGINAPYDESPCAGPGDIDIVNDQFSITSTSIPTMQSYSSPSYTPDGSISVQVLNGTCVGTYSIAISPITGSGPEGSTPPTPLNSPRVGIGQGTYVFQQAGIGKYVVIVAQIGGCNPSVNPLRDTVTVGSVAGSEAAILYLLDANNQIVVDTDPFTTAESEFGLGELSMDNSDCFRTQRYYIMAQDREGDAIDPTDIVMVNIGTANGSSVTLGAYSNGLLPLDIRWGAGSNIVTIMGVYQGETLPDMMLSATITDTEPPVLTCTPDTVVFNGQASIALVQSNLVSISDNCSSGAAIQTTTTLQSVSCAQLGQLLPVGFMATDGNGNSAACVSQVYVSGLPCGWSSDPGGIGCNSAASYQPGTGLWTLNANQCYSQSPYTSDSLAYAWKTLCGDGSITAAVMSLNDINGWAGITMRETAQAGSKKVQLTTNRHSAVLRREIRYVSNGQAFPDVFPSPQRHWLRLVRSGNRITGYASSDGQSWHYVMDVVLPMNQCIQVGLVAHGINRFQQVTATFAHVSTSGLEVPPLSGGEMPQESVAPYDMAVYPNPTEGMVQLRLPEDIGTEANLEILDMRGQVLMSRRMRAVDAEERLDMRGYPNGMYWIRLSQRVEHRYRNELCYNDNKSGGLPVLVIPRFCFTVLSATDRFPVCGRGRTARHCELHQSYRG